MDVRGEHDRQPASTICRYTLIPRWIASRRLVVFALMTASVTAGHRAVALTGPNWSPDRLRCQHVSRECSPTTQQGRPSGRFDFRRSAPAIGRSTPPVVLLPPVGWADYPAEPQTSADQASEHAIDPTTDDQSHAETKSQLPPLGRPWPRPYSPPSVEFETASTPELKNAADGWVPTTHWGARDAFQVRGDQSVGRQNSPAGVSPASRSAPEGRDSLRSNGDSETAASGAQFGGEVPERDPCAFDLQFLPDGLLYRSYLAGEKEPRFSSVWFYERGRGWIWEAALGGRFGMWRYGTADVVHPEGWQLDVEGAVFPRIDPIEASEMDSVDFRAGGLVTWRRGPTAVKAGYYHISSHIADEFLLRNPTFQRIEYVRDSLITGVIHNVTDDVALYGEVAYALKDAGGAEPWEFQFGAQYNPVCASRPTGSPFAAVNGHLREEFGFGGSVNAVAGWHWRGTETGHVFRTGFQYFNGKSLQYQFFDKHEELLGVGFWLDF